VRGVRILSLSPRWRGNTLATCLMMRRVRLYYANYALFVDSIPFSARPTSESGGLVACARAANTCFFLSFAFRGLLRNASAAWAIIIPAAPRVRSPRSFICLPGLHVIVIGFCRCQGMFACGGMHVSITRLSLRAVSD